MDFAGVEGRRTMRLLASGLVTALSAIALSSANAESILSGDYVEARTCSVYTGACHANGESVTTGREAILSWHVNKGTVDGQALDGFNAVVVVQGKDNLGTKDCLKTCVVYLDSRANETQRQALLDILQEKFACSMGRIASVKTAAIEFGHKGLEYTVRIPGAAYLKTTRYACSHCVMPHMQWYDPLVHLKSSLVAKAAYSEFKGAPELPVRWTRLDENSSFVGEFSF